MSRRKQNMPLLVVFGLLTACSTACSVDEQLEEQLQGEPCTVAKDCWHTQDCMRTIDEANLGLPGLCQPEGTGCVEGQQLGCTCNPADSLMNCSFSAYPPALQAIYPKMACDPKLLVCVVAPQGGG